MSKVGFVGLGQMGWPMASNLDKAGFALVVYDGAPGRSDQFAAEIGGVAASGPADFAECEIVITMLPDGSVVQQALFDWEGGIAASLPSGALVVEMSSSNPSDTRQLAERLAEHDVRLVDAPVSGGVARAIDGSLAVMVGGDGAQIDRASAVLDGMGDPARRFRTGPLGTGHAMKALNNFVTATTYVATTEAMVVGQTLGLEPATMAHVISASTGRSFTSEVVVGQHIVTGEYATGFKLGLLAKDVSIAADIASKSGVDAPTAALTSRMWNKAAETLDPLGDHSLAHQAWWPTPLVDAADD